MIRALPENEWPDADTVAAAIRAASVAVGQVRITAIEDPEIDNTGIVIGKIAKRILEELRREG